MEDNSFSKKLKIFFPNPILNIFFILCFLAIFLYYTLSAPLSNKAFVRGEGTTIHVASGESLRAVATELEAKSVVRQASALQFFVEIFRLGRPIMRGDYLFKERLPVWRVAWSLANGNHGIDPIRITLKEGFTNIDMAQTLGDKLLAFRRDLFLSDDRSKQGYLFPDTYFFYQLTTSSEIVDELSGNFNKKISSLMPDINNSSHSLDDIVSMASIIQKEARDEKDAYIISGILWKRIEKNIPLQVDADRETYKTLGLPVQPISNPGLLAIKAALYPQASDYLYYIHDKTGTAHFAATFAEHQKNIARYLK